MSDNSLLNEVRAKAQAWTQPPHDEDTRRTVQGGWTLATPMTRRVKR